MAAICAFLLLLPRGGALAYPGDADRARVVGVALAFVAPVGHPGEICRVEIGGQAFLETVKLIEADEMHIARQGCLVPGGSQVWA